VHVGMGFFDLVEQHHAVGTPPNRLGQHAAFAVAHVARSEPLSWTRCALPKFAHVDGDGVRFTAVQCLAKASAVSVFPPPLKARQHEHADGLLGFSSPAREVLSAGIISRLALTNHPLPRCRPASTRFDFILTMRPTGMPVHRPPRKPLPADRRWAE